MAFLLKPDPIITAAWPDRSRAAISSKYGRRLAGTDGGGGSFKVDTCHKSEGHAIANRIAGLPGNRAVDLA